MTSVERGVERVAHVRVDGIAWRIPERITTTGERVCRAWDGEHRRQLSPRPEMLERTSPRVRGWVEGGRQIARARQLPVAVACMHVPRGRCVNTRGEEEGERGGGTTNALLHVQSFLSCDYFHSLASSRDDRAGIFK